MLAAPGILILAAPGIAPMQRPTFGRHGQHIKTPATSLHGRPLGNKLPGRRLNAPPLLRRYGGMRQRLIGAIFHLDKYQKRAALGD